MPFLPRAFSTLDAAHRGAGNRGVFAVFGQQMAIGERLCIEGYLGAERRTLRHAQPAMINVDVEACSFGRRIVAGADYDAFCAALDTFGL